MFIKLFSICVILLSTSKLSLAEDVVYKMCVPHKYYEDCLTLLKDPSEAGINMECVSGRDRIECLDLINQKKADVLAADPEDMYVAYHMKNQDFRVISEFRTKIEKDAEFRYEGVILVKKSTKLHSLKELQGLKSCHTGFGRNVGYKIPITKLKNHNVLKISQDPSISATERELKALSAFFSKSCLVGTYSQNPDIDLLLKKKYSNLCALCEKPEQCNYPDKFSGYDGAIRCLDKGEGEVAFTKTSFIKKYFGLIDGVTAEGDPANFEYFCEDGSRKPITGSACSWAQRPWKGYISSNDAVHEKTLLDNLQKRLNTFFENGLKAENKKSASNLLIDSELVLHEKQDDVKPKEYLERAGYRDVIERDGSLTHKIKLCLQTTEEAEKCDALRRAAFSRDIRPEFDCFLDTNCIEAVKTGKADAAVLSGGSNYINAKSSDLKPLMFETFNEDDVYVVVVNPELNSEALTKRPVKFDQDDERAKLSALLLNHKRGLNTCELPTVDSDSIEIVHAKHLNDHKNKMLYCLDGSKKAVTEFKTCNFEAQLPNGIFVKNDISPIVKDSFVHSFSLVSDRFGHDGKLEDVFELFGEFKKGKKNVIFHDNAVKLSTDVKYINGVDENMDKEIHCQK